VSRPGIPEVNDLRMARSGPLIDKGTP